MSKLNKPILVLLSALPLLVGGVLTLVQGYEAVTNSYFFIGYGIVVALSLPALISKVIFNKSYFGITAAFCFLWYLALYLLAYFVDSVLGVEAAFTLRVMAILNLVLWHNLVGFVVLTSSKAVLIAKLKLSLIALVPALVFTLILVTQIRQLDTIAALDYLQHQTVVNKMYLDGELCLLPNQCSNLFLQYGYTTIYHSTLGFMGSFLGVGITKLFFMLDIIWPLIASFVLLKLFRGITTNKLLLGVGVAVGLFTFVNGAYEFIFFIPQTLAFYLFLQILSIGKLDYKKVLLSAIILLPTHFIMGGFLTVFLVLKWLLIDTEILKKLGIPSNILLWGTPLLVGYVIISNQAGFSFEKQFQQADLKLIGGETNMYAPFNYNFVLGLLGFVTIVALLALIHFVLNSNKSRIAKQAVLFLVLNIITYFIAPTYANKFLIGFGIWFGILIVDYLKDIKFRSNLLVAISGVLIISSLGFNFIVNYHEYLNFYRQGENYSSAISGRDQTVIDFLNDNRQDCMVISDPLTQVVIAAYANQKTAHAQYLLPSSRQAIQKFNTDPTIDNLIALKTIKEVDDVSKLCYLITPRLLDAAENKKTGWTNNMYDLLFDNTYTLNSDASVIKFLKKNTNEIKATADFYLYKI